MRLLLFPFLLVLLGCQQGSNQTQPYLYGTTPANKTVNYKESVSEKKELAQIDADTQQEIARINMQKEIEVQRLKNDVERQKAELETNSSIQKAVIEKEVALSAQELSKNLHESQSAMQKWWLLGLLGALGIVLFFIYLMVQKRNAMQLRLQNEKLEHEKQLKEQEMRLNMAHKILDTLASGQVSQEQQERLLDALEQKPGGQLPPHK